MIYSFLVVILKTIENDIYIYMQPDILWKMFFDYNLKKIDILSDLKVLDILL